ncbi:hypothetical protein ANCDUO_00245 [Ancylostoma duodenale]|uniref:Uncharacterized protein n=1 Tax=Ancylostoma duodenale TaxID=51022 RepID=A0A0C2HCM2_9BILA|nr:hypothetical protein ANCDUO_00245 [Ancylostoma duodenale]
MPDQISDTAAQNFINRFVARFGQPETPVIDQGSHYMINTFFTMHSKSPSSYEYIVSPAKQWPRGEQIVQYRNKLLLLLDNTMTTGLMSLNSLATIETG